MTTVEAVTEVLNEWIPGTALYGYEIHRKVLRKLDAAGTKKKKPLDSTTLRRMRERANIYGVRAIKPADSLYIRDEKRGNATPSPTEATA